MTSTPSNGTLAFIYKDQTTQPSDFTCLISPDSSSQEVCSLLIQEPNKIKADPKLLNEALIREFSDHEHSLIAALDVKQFIKPISNPEINQTWHSHGDRSVNQSPNLDSHPRFQRHTSTRTSKTDINKTQKEIRANMKNRKFPQTRTSRRRLKFLRGLRENFGLNYSLYFLIRHDKL